MPSWKAQLWWDVGKNKTRPDMSRHVGRAATPRTVRVSDVCDVTVIFFIQGKYFQNPRLQAVKFMNQWNISQEHVNAVTFYVKVRKQIHVSKCRWRKKGCPKYIYDLKPARLVSQWWSKSTWNALEWQDFLSTCLGVVCGVPATVDSHMAMAGCHL